MDQRLTIVDIHQFRLSVRQFRDFFEGGLGIILKIKGKDLDAFALQIGRLYAVVCQQNTVRDVTPGQEIACVDREILELAALPSWWGGASPMRRTRVGGSGS